MRQLSARLLICGFMLFAASVTHAEDAKPFITAQDLDLRNLLAPPPANGSAQMQAELGELLTLQVTRTPPMVARAQADVVENVWRFEDVMGSQFVAAKLPNVDAFFARLVATEDVVVDAAKAAWKRPRPHQYSASIAPAVKLSNSGAYPSGHTTVGTLMAIVLSNLVPEKRAAIMARAQEYGNNRMVGGMHYRSDIEAGRIAGTLIAANLMTRPDFNAAFEKAQIELRHVLAVEGQ